MTTLEAPGKASTLRLRACWRRSWIKAHDWAVTSARAAALGLAAGGVVSAS